MTVKVNLIGITEARQLQREILEARLAGASESEANNQPFNPDRMDLANIYQVNHRNKLLLARTIEQLKAIDKALPSTNKRWHLR